MVRRSIVAAALAAASWHVCALGAAASWLAELRGGAAVPIHDELRDALGLEVGPAFGATLGWKASESFAFDLRFDALWLSGTATAVAISNHFYIWETDTSMETYAISAGPTLHTDAWGLELDLGLHPGLYLSTFDAIDAVRGLDGMYASKDFSSSVSADCGFNAEVGARVPVTDSFLVGAELAYHLVFVRDLADDTFGALIGSLSVAWRG